MKKDCNKKVCVIVLFFTFIFPVISIIILFLKKPLFELAAKYIDWFKENQVLGFICYVLAFLFWFPPLLPPLIIIALGGWTFSKSFGSTIGYFLCILATTLGYTPGCLATFMIGKKCCHNYL